MNEDFLWLFDEFGLEEDTDEFPNEDYDTALSIFISEALGITSYDILHGATKIVICPKGDYVYKLPFNGYYRYNKKMIILVLNFLNVPMENILKIIAQQNLSYIMK